MRHKETIAMILAGGQGSRLGALTNRIAKPGLPFGGKYKIIDFALSNCANSGITTVGVLTQYQPLELNTYIASGQPWDMDRLNGGVYILPPYIRGQRGEWYKGTANAIYQNMRFIEQFAPENVVILSGDHIYTMDYRLMRSFHKKSGAALTIAVIEVPISEAGRYGILSADETGKIHGFEEKPKNPASNLASMGVYIFDWAELRKYLIDDENNPASGNDFGHDVIPAMLRDGRGVYAYRFEGYWKDVGTIKSLWEANMDMLGESPELDLDDDAWRIYSRHIDLPPQVISPTAEITNSAVTEGCMVAGRVDNSILFSGVRIEEGAVVSDSIVMPFAVVEKGATVKKAVIADSCIIGETAQIGSETPDVAHRRDPLCSDGLTLVAEGVKIGPGVKVGSGVSVLADIFSADAAIE